MKSQHITKTKFYWSNVLGSFLVTILASFISYYGIASLLQPDSIENTYIILVSLVFFVPIATFVWPLLNLLVSTICNHYGKKLLVVPIISLLAICFLFVIPLNIQQANIHGTEAWYNSFSWVLYTIILFNFLSSFFINLKLSRTSKNLIVPLTSS